MIIGLAGRKRSGKSTAAAALVAVGFERMAFADPLKWAVRYFLVKAGVSDEMAAHYMNDAKEEVIPQLGRTFREMAQTLGTEWGASVFTLIFG